MRTAATRLSTGIALFRWLVVNLLAGNNDNHLKSLSFFVSHQGIELAPHYDLLCTLAYDTKALSDTADLKDWSERPLVFTLPSATQFRQVRRPSVVEAGVALVLAAGMAGRILDETRAHIEKAAAELLRDDTPHIQGNPQHLRVALAMRHIVMAEMLERLR